MYDLSPRHRDNGTCDALRHASTNKPRRSAVRGRLEFITAPHTPGARAAANVKRVSFTSVCFFPDV